MTGPRASNKIALVGLDGATFRVLEPLVAEGIMPALGHVMAEGGARILRSTVPTYTPPAWVSMATGVNPGRHGVFGFLLKTPQEPVQIVHSGLIDAPPMWRYLNELGIATGVFNIPMYYPPEAVDGFMVAGGLAAGWSDTDLPNFSTDLRVLEIASRAAGRPYPLDTVVAYENDWRSQDAVVRITDVQRIRRRVLVDLLEAFDVDVLFAVFEGVDRLQHLHYQYLVECSSWYSHPNAPAYRSLAHEYFAELDATISELVSWAGEDGHVLIVSDHGFGPWEKTLNVNLLLQEWGYLKLPSVARMTRLKSVATHGQRLARQLLPRRFLHELKARVASNIPWENATAFASHVAEQGIHVNVRGELPRGTVEPSRVSSIEQELIERLSEYTDPEDRRPVVDAVVRRDDVVAGPHHSRAPHLFPFCRDQRYELSDTLAATSLLTDHRDRPWGYHHSDGILISAGPHFASTDSRPRSLEIVDVLPNLFHLMGLTVPEAFEGEVRKDLFSGEAATRQVRVGPQRPEHAIGGDNPYSSEEEAAIEESLRGLGYLE